MFYLQLNLQVANVEQMDDPHTNWNADFPMTQPFKCKWTMETIAVDAPRDMILRVSSFLQKKIEVFLYYLQISNNSNNRIADGGKPVLIDRTITLPVHRDGHGIELVNYVLDWFIVRYLLFSFFTKIISSCTIRKASVTTRRTCITNRIRLACGCRPTTRSSQLMVACTRRFLCV